MSTSTPLAKSTCSIRRHRTQSTNSTGRATLESMESRKATDVDLIEVLGRLCKAHDEELAYVGLNRTSGLALLRGFMWQGRAEAGTVKGRAECIFGVNETAGRNYVWFVATDIYFKQGPAAIRFGRRYLRDLEAEIGQLYARTTSKGAAVEKWLKTLGFVRFQDSWVFNGLA